MKCPYCKKEAIWVPNEIIYGKRYGKSYMCYFCKECDAYVGCHNNSKKALGTMANRELREWRVKAHEAIDPLWKETKYSRTYIYRILWNIFGEEVHIGSSDIQRCKDIIEEIQHNFPPNTPSQEK